MLILKHTIDLMMDGGLNKVEVRLFKPERSQKSWTCKYEIFLPEGRHAMVAHGVAAVQALSIALQMIGAELYTSDYHRNNQLRYSSKEGGYGFPVPRNLRDMLVGEDAAAFG